MTISERIEKLIENSVIYEIRSQDQKVEFLVSTKYVEQLVFLVRELPELVNAIECIIEFQKIRMADSSAFKDVLERLEKKLEAME